MKEVKHLFEQFKPEHYDLEINLDVNRSSFKGTVTIQGMKAGRPAKRIALHQNGLNITAAEITYHDKKDARELIVSRINLHKSFDEVRLHTESMVYPGRYTVTVHFGGKIQQGMHGIYLSTYKHAGKDKTVVSTQFESHHAREAFPCIDEPEAKATFNLKLVTPLNESVIGNMPIKKQTKKAGTITTEFETTPRMSTYLLAFVCGDLQYKETFTKDNVAVRVWATKAHDPAALDYPLEVIKNGIEFFNTYYGVPYPLPKCDNVAIPDFSSAAMENWGLITYREIVLLVDPKTASHSNHETAAIVSLHELSHQWFGNLVTMKWWDDLWLNESFANVMEYVATNALYPEWKIWNTFASSEGLSALRRDALTGVQAVRTKVNHPEEISSLFDPSIVYAKGGRLLNMLMNYVGEKDFTTALTLYFATHAYGNTSGDDLWAALSTTSKQDIKAFMNPWLTLSGYPVIDVDQHSRKLNLKQRHFALNPKKADSKRVWPVPMLCDTDDVPLLLDAPSLDITLSTDQFVQINQGAVGHYIVNYVQDNHRNAIASLVPEKKLSEAERLMLLSDSTLLSRGSVHSFDVTLKLLEYYRAEDSEPVWDIISIVVADLRRFIDAQPALEDKIKKLIRNLIALQHNRLGWDEVPNENVQDTKLRATIISLGVYSEHEAIVEHALKLFEAYKNKGADLSPELRSIIFGAAIRNSVKGAFEYLLELEENTTNVNLKQDLMNALTLARNPHQIDILLGRLKDGKKVRLHDVDHWLVYLMQNRFAQEKAWKWMRDNWSWIEHTFSGDKSYDYFPRYAASALNTRKRLEEYILFFEPYKNHLALGRNVTIGIEELTTRIAWLERDAVNVQNYLET